VIFSWLKKIILHTHNFSLTTYMERAVVIRRYSQTTNTYTGCIKKKVIELQRAIVSELLCVWTRFFHNRKDHAFSCWMISSSC
jgi:hypothetical protein